MPSLKFALLFIPSFLQSSFAETWPYNRYIENTAHSGTFLTRDLEPIVEASRYNHFGEWFHRLVENGTTKGLQSVFVNGSVPHHIESFEELLDYVDVPTLSLSSPEFSSANASSRPPGTPLWPQDEAAAVFKHLPYPIDPRCLTERSKWWYRTYDGSCNWLKVNEISEGQLGTAKARDYNQHAYADGISSPREGPNARAVSNAFFRRKKTIYYEHTPLLLGLIEFIMHDITYSQDSTTESIIVPMPEDEDYFEANTAFQVWRTLPVPGTGTDKENPRENINMASTWLDVSALYGSTAEVANSLRSFSGGRLLTQELLTRGNKAEASYLPFNTMKVPMRTRPGVKSENLFAGGDPRTNEDWVMLGVHTLLLREHNRLCNILTGQHPEYEDEQLYQTIRLVMSSKFAMIANAYQMAYWTDEMPWPRDDGFPLYRQMYGKGVMDINPANAYPWPLVTKAGKPMVVSAEMAIVYRFHDFIVPSFPMKDKHNDTIWEQDLFATGFNSTGFVDAGLENVLRGMTAVSIPNFKSGVDEAFRSAGKYRGRPFDIVTWSIIHEREQGLPTFNTYFRAHNGQDPKVEVPIRDCFEDFSTDPQAVADLKRLYNTPDDVDLVVGVQLDEEMFPGTTVPKTALIISLFSLFGMGNSDRFSIGFAIMRCLLVDKPWDCHPSNALEEILWIKKPKKGFPNFRFLDEFWLTEMDFQAHGTNLLWRLVTENTEIECLQQKPLYPVDPITNPVLCTLPYQKVDHFNIAVISAQIGKVVIKSHAWKATALLIATLLLIISYFRDSKDPHVPPVLKGWPILGEALTFQKDPRKLLEYGYQRFGKTLSRSFGIRLASFTHFVLAQSVDLELMLDDNEYEAKFSLHEFFKIINIAIITRNENFESDLHSKLMRNHLSNPETVSRFQETVDHASNLFLRRNPLVLQGKSSERHQGLNDYITRYITFVTSRCMVGADSFDNPKLLQTFMEFNNNAIEAMGLGQLLPGFLQFIASRTINKNFKTIRKVLIPVIQRRKSYPPGKRDELINFLDFILDTVTDSERAADTLAIIVWTGLTNLQATVSSTILDIINQPKLQEEVLSSLSTADTTNLNTFGSAPSWTTLRSSMFESIRLAGPIIGPSRTVVEQTTLSSDPTIHVPKGQIVTMSAYHTHRDTSLWGLNAASFQSDRFMKENPPIGTTKFLAWGLKGPHCCPGRWFGQATIQLMTKAILEEYIFEQDSVIPDNDKYIYSAGSVVRKQEGILVRRRKLPEMECDYLQRQTDVA